MLNTTELEGLIRLRHQLHQNAELSGQETNTAKLISQFIRECKPDRLIENISEHGILAIWDGAKPGYNTLFRAELDALPIQESNNLTYSSFQNGISHKCGHDGHMAILCGLAIKLANKKPSSGSIMLLFQPAEETGQGARAVLASKKFQSVRPDYVFALHNLPKQELGKILCKQGVFCPASVGLKIKLQGKTAHASQPDTGNNPALATAQLILAFENILKANSFNDKTLITLTHTTIGEKSFGVSAGHSDIWFTLRAFDQRDFDELVKMVEKEAKRIAYEHELAINLSYHEGFEVTENHEDVVDIIKSAAEQNGLNYEPMLKPNPWSEDFGLFLKETKGAMFGLGSGIETPDLHNPDYDFPDELIESGSKMFWAIINQLNA